MIIPRTDQRQAAVADHYDGLDRVYREVWGEHVHHGLWRRGDESVAEATRALVDLVLSHLALPRGGRVADVGCGYAATTAILADELGAEAVGFTLSTAQAARARGDLDVRVRSWLENGLPDAWADGIVAIESLSHMAPKERAFGELGRVVAPGGRVVLVDWLSCDDPGPLRQRLLLEPIAREGRLPSLHTVDEYGAFLRAAGLDVTAVEDLSRHAWRTWLIVARRMALRLARDRAEARELLSARNPDRAFVLSLARIPIALRTGTMRLVLVSARRPG